MSEPLTDAEREALASHQFLLPGVYEAAERIIAARVKEKAEAIAKKIEAEGQYRPGEINYTADFRDGLRCAARIARAEAVSND